MLRTAAQRCVTEDTKHTLIEQQAGLGRYSLADVPLLQCMPGFKDTKWEGSWEELRPRNL